MSVKRIVFTVLCALLVLVLIMTGVTVVKFVQLFNNPDSTEPSQTEPSASDTTAGNEPSTDPSTEATTPPTTEATQPPTSKPTESTGSNHTHSFNTVLTSQAATCTDSGYRELQCSCGETKWEVQEKLDHSFGYGKTIPATCESDGCTRYTCSTCGHVEDRNIVKALGHAYDKGVFHPATCTEDAYTEYTCANANCPEKVMRETQEDSALDHHFSNWVDVNDVLTQTCSNCKITQTTDDLKVTENFFTNATDLQGNPYKVHEIYIGTAHSPIMYDYKITDFVSVGELVLRYDFEDGLTVTYTDSDHKEHTIILDPKGEDTTLEKASQSPDSTETEPSPEGTTPSTTEGTNEA